MKDKNQQTHFGYEKVKSSDKANKVGAVFSSVASRYDIMNDFMSMGLHRLWKRFAIGLLKLRPGLRVLDLAAGSADLSLKIMPKIMPGGELLVSDINADMLAVGRDRLLDKGYLNAHVFLADAQALPLADNSLDRVMISFGLRNVTDKAAALNSIYRCLKPGGRLVVLEFSKPTHPLLAKAYDTYSFNVIPKLGKLVANDEASYQYLVESIRMHPDQESLKAMMLESGFDQVDYHNLSAGVVAAHVGEKF